VVYDLGGLRVPVAALVDLIREGDLMLTGSR
jgi:hypothetical protein